MRISIILNSRFEAIPIYISLLVFQNECSDITSERYPEFIEQTKRMIVVIDVSSNDSYKSYLFSEPELATVIEALRYVKSRKLFLVRQGDLTSMIKKLKEKYYSLCDAIEQS